MAIDIGNLVGGSFTGHPDLTLAFIPPVKLESEAYFHCRVKPRKAQSSKL
jgi:hypothetical protein